MFIVCFTNVYCRIIMRRLYICQVYVFSFFFLLLYILIHFVKKIKNVSNECFSQYISSFYSELKTYYRTIYLYLQFLHFILSLDSPLTSPHNQMFFNLIPLIKYDQNHKVNFTSSRKDIL